MGKTSLPAETWNFCDRELDLYELHKLAAADLRKDMIKWGTTDIYVYDFKKGVDVVIERLRGPEIRELELEIKKIEDTYRKLNPQQQQFVKLHYRKHYPLASCQEHMNYSRSRIAAIKKEVVTKTAIGLGLI